MQRMYAKRFLWVEMSPSLEKLYLLGRSGARRTGVEKALLVSIHVDTDNCIAITAIRKKPQREVQNILLDADEELLVVALASGCVPQDRLQANLDDRLDQCYKPSSSTAMTIP
jgi:hypothetical protein